MLGLLKNVFSKKKQEPKPLSKRDQNGRNNVGYPTMQVSREIDAIVQKYYRPIKPVIQLYKDTLFFKWAPGIINNELSDEQLESLSGRNVQMVYLLLFRDMLRHISEFVTPKNAPDNWADLFAQEVLDNCNMLGDADDQDIAKKQALFSENKCYSIENPIDEKHPENTVIPAWTSPLADLILMSPYTIYKWHRPLMATILKKLNKKSKTKTK